MEINVVSIPRSEFWSFGRAARPIRRPTSAQFQFLGRNSGRSDTHKELKWPSITMFQFLGRNSGRSDPSGIPRLDCGLLRFNSSVGILVVRTPTRRASSRWL